MGNSDLKNNLIENLDIDLLKDGIKDEDLESLPKSILDFNIEEDVKFNILDLFENNNEEFNYFTLFSEDLNKIDYTKLKYCNCVYVRKDDKFSFFESYEDSTKVVSMFNLTSFFNGFNLKIGDCILVGYEENDLNMCCAIKDVISINDEIIKEKEIPSELQLRQTNEIFRGSNHNFNTLNILKITDNLNKKIEDILKNINKGNLAFIYSTKNFKLKNELKNVENINFIPLNNDEMFNLKSLIRYFSIIKNRKDKGQKIHFIVDDINSIYKLFLYYFEKKSYSYNVSRFMAVEMISKIINNNEICTYILEENDKIIDNLNKIVNI